MTVSTEELSPRADDGRETLAARLFDALGRHPGTAMRFDDGGQWVTRSYAEVLERGRALARGLIALGAGVGDRVAILSTTRPEWTLADLAVLWSGGTGVPIYQTNSPEECEYVLRDSGSRIVLCEDADQLAKIEAVRGRLPELEHVVAFTGVDAGAITLEELAGRGRAVASEQVESRIAATSSTDACTIVYTSGTTGPPKGCVLTQGNVASNIDMVERRMEFGAGPHVFYLWLPLAHVLARVVQYLALDLGAELGYWRRDPKKLLDDVAELQPTHLPSVPRVFEKIYTAARSGAGESRLKALLLDWGIGVGRRFQVAQDSGGRVPPVLAVQHPLADRLVLRRIRGLFGPRLEFAVTGAAPVDPEILRFFHAAGVYVLEGYGMTEATAVATVNTVPEHKFGTVGKPLPECEIRIAEDGEVLIRGPHVFAGYFNHPEATKETLADGWLRSGDLGRLDADGFLAITGRKKELIITSSGKNVAPASIENALKQDRWISQAVVYGDRRPYLTALITLDPAETPALAAKLGIAPDPSALAADERVRAEIGRVIDEVNSKFARVEQVKRFSILDRDLSVEEGELTPTAKVKRSVVYDRYADRFSALYEEPDPDAGTRA